VYPGQSGTITHDRLFGIHKSSSFEMRRIISSIASSYVQYSWIDRSKIRASFTLPVLLRSALTLIHPVHPDLRLLSPIYKSPCLVSIELHLIIRMECLFDPLTHRLNLLFKNIFLYQ
jgi:hypothetical protein